MNAINPLEVRGGIIKKKGSGKMNFQRVMSKVRKADLEDMVERVTTDYLHLSFYKPLFRAAGLGEFSPLEEREALHKEFISWVQAGQPNLGEVIPLNWDGFFDFLQGTGWKSHSVKSSSFSGSGHLSDAGVTTTTTPYLTKGKSTISAGQFPATSLHDAEMAEIRQFVGAETTEEDVHQWARKNLQTETTETFSDGTVGEVFSAGLQTASRI